MNLRREFTGAKTLWNYAFVFTLIVYAVGMLVPVMQDDAAVYAEISREMYERGNYLEIFKNGAEWLDKPHFQFWITAFFYKIFGVNSFAYKLPGVIFTLVAVWFTYLFASRFYSKKHGFIAALLLMTAQHIIISVNDVRAEPFLTCFTIMGLYFFAMYLQNKKIANIIAGSVALACLMMTKGLFTIIPVVTGIGFSLLYQKKWKDIFNWHWILAGVLTFIFIMPTLYGYYVQFDLHPEKVIFGKHNISGVEFFLWTSQWGRFMNNGPIVKDSGSVFYFLHTILWAFAPWAVIGFFALYQKAKLLIKRINYKESYTFFGFIFLFIIFSLSKFQLSFYLNPLFPFLAIICADTLLSFGKNQKFLKTFSIIQISISVVIIGVVIMLQVYFFDKSPSADSIILFLIALLISFFLFVRKASLKKIIFIPALIFLSANYYVNRDFYPALLTYQYEDRLTDFIKLNNIPVAALASVDVQQSIVNFHLQYVIPQYDLSEASEKNLTGKYVYTTDAGLEKIRLLNLNPQVITTFNNFHVTKLTPVFINKNTRQSVLQKRYLVKIN